MSKYRAESVDLSQQKEDQLKAILREMDRLAIAFSGGVDSTYLLALAMDVLGPGRTLALTADSPLVPRRELAEARSLAGHLGAAHHVLVVNPLSDESIVSNPPDRCYHCKRAIFSSLLSAAHGSGFATLAHGANVDDQADYRPGQKAAEELGVVAPLQAAGLTKAEIRELSRRRDLPTWDRPAQACLATRVPYNTPLDGPTLQRIERAEDVLRQRLGVQSLRVRAHGPVARLELPPADWPALLEPAAREAVIAALQQLGFGAVALDLAGLRSGSMNQLTLPPA